MALINNMDLVVHSKVSAIRLAKDGRGHERAENRGVEFDLFVLIGGLHLGEREGRRPEIQGISQGGVKASTARLGNKILLGILLAHKAETNIELDHPCLGGGLAKVQEESQGAGGLVENGGGILADTTVFPGPKVSKIGDLRLGDLSVQVYINSLSVFVCLHV